jgi:hypothetical protein
MDPLFGIEMERSSRVTLARGESDQPNVVVVIRSAQGLDVMLPSRIFIA